MCASKAVSAHCSLPLATVPQTIEFWEGTGVSKLTHQAELAPTLNAIASKQRMLIAPALVLRTEQVAYLAPYPS